MNRYTILSLLLCINFVIVGSARAANSSNYPQEPLPIKYGIYVVEGAQCPKPSETSYSDSLTYGNAKLPYGGSIYYFNDNNNNLYCPITKMSHSGDTYKITEVCMTGVGAHQHSYHYHY